MNPIRPLFARHGLRCTRQREEVYRALAASSTHPTAEELLLLVRNRLPEISLATVYNSLDAFTRRGLARKFSTPPPTNPGTSTAAEPARYDADTSEHIHFVTEQGRIRDVPADLGAMLIDNLPREVVEQLERRMGIQVDLVRLELRGRDVSPGSC